MAIEIVDRLLKSDDKADELECFLGQHFNHAQHVENSVIEYRGGLRVIKENYFVTSDKLKEIRETLRAFPQIERYAGKAIQLSFVVDTNIIIGDILWLVQKRKNPNARTQLQEVLAAETVILSAPINLVTEINEHLPKIAKDKGLCLEKLTSQWLEYRQSITFIEVPKENLFESRPEDDEKDIPFIVLKEMIGADGILSKDTDIKRMDSDAINIQCIASLQSYSRACAIQLNIRVNGTMMAGFSLVALMAAFEGLKALITAIKNSPKQVHLILGGAVLFTALYPPAHKRVADFIRKTYNISSEHFPLLMDIIAKNMAIANEHKIKANAALDSLPDNLQQKIKSDS